MWSIMVAFTLRRSAMPYLKFRKIRAVALTRLKTKFRISFNDDVHSG